MRFVHSCGDTICYLFVPWLAYDWSLWQVALAKRADRVVLALGTNLSMAHESDDAVSIALPPGQLALVLAVAAAAKAPVVAVIFTGVPLDLSPLLSNPNIGAILHVGQPAVQTLGIGDLIFGKRVPAGRTAFTMYPESFARQISIFDSESRARYYLARYIADGYIDVVTPRQI
jgi:beta-D-xylosidase 4